MSRDRKSCRRQHTHSNTRVCRVVGNVHSDANINNCRQLSTPRATEMSTIRHIKLHICYNGRHLTFVVSVLASTRRGRGSQRRQKSSEMSREGRCQMCSTLPMYEPSPLPPSSQFLYLSNATAPLFPSGSMLSRLYRLDFFAGSKNPGVER